MQKSIIGNGFMNISAAWLKVLIDVHVFYFWCIIGSDNTQQLYLSCMVIFLEYEPIPMRPNYLWKPWNIFLEKYIESWHLLFYSPVELA